MRSRFACTGTRGETFRRGALGARPNILNVANRARGVQSHKSEARRTARTAFFARCIGLGAPRPGRGVPRGARDHDSGP